MAETWSFPDNVIFLWPKLPWASLVAQMVKSLPARWETQVQSLGQEDLLEKGMAKNSSILAWKIPWMEKAGGLQSMGLQRVTNTNHLRRSPETDSEHYSHISSALSYHHQLFLFKHPSVLLFHPLSQNSFPSRPWPWVWQGFPHHPAPSACPSLPPVLEECCCCLCHREG